MHRKTAVPVIVCLLVSCGGAASDEDSFVEDLPQLTLTEELRIGSVDDPDAGFSQIGGVTIGPDGSLYVIEQQDNEVRVYDAQGTLVRRFGRQGEGPGEFLFPSQLGVVGDTLWVTDLRLQRLSLFTTSGEFLKSFSPPPTPLTLASNINAMLTVGGLRSDGTLGSGWSVAIPRDPPQDTVMIPIVRMDTTGAIIDTIRLQPWAFPARQTIDLGGRPLPVPGETSPMPLYVDAADDGVFVVHREVASNADEGTIRVERFDVDGDTQWVRELRYRPRPYNDAVIDSMISRYRGMYQMMGVDLDAAQARVREAMKLPPFQPPISAAYSGQDGTLWLRREDDGGPMWRWVVLGADGAPLGALTLPRNALVRWPDARKPWFSEADDMDVPWLVRYGVRQ